MAPLYHIFGSEELSVHTPGVARLSPEPFLGLNPEDAQRLGVSDGSRVRLAVNGLAQDLPVRMMDSLPEGLAGLPVGLPGMPHLELPDWGEVTIHA